MTTWYRITQHAERPSGLRAFGGACATPKAAPIDRPNLQVPAGEQSVT